MKIFSPNITLIKVKLCYFNNRANRGVTITFYSLHSVFSFVVGPAAVNVPVL